MGARRTLDQLMVGIGVDDLEPMTPANGSTLGTPTDDRRYHTELESQPLPPLAG